MSRQQTLLEIWGDTVDSRNLWGAIALGAGVAAPSYLFAAWVFPRFVENADVARTYALLVGLVGCIAAAVVAAFLFKPQRVVTESEGTAESRAAAMDTIESEIGPLGDPAELPERVQAELRTLGLYDDLAARHQERQQRGAAGGESDASQSEVKA